MPWEHSNVNARCTADALRVARIALHAVSADGASRCRGGRSWGGLPRRPPAPSLALEESRFAEADELRSSLRRYDSFCLNQEEESPDPAMRRELARFLHRYFPHPAPWELPEGPDGPSDSVP